MVETPKGAGEMSAIAQVAATLARSVSNEAELVDAVHSGAIVRHDPLLRPLLHVDGWRSVPEEAIKALSRFIIAFFSVDPALLASLDPYVLLVALLEGRRKLKKEEVTDGGRRREEQRLKTLQTLTSLVCAHAIPTSCLSRFFTRVRCLMEELDGVKGGLGDVFHALSSSVSLSSLGGAPCAFSLRGRGHGLVLATNERIPARGMTLMAWVWFSSLGVKKVGEREVGIDGSGGSGSGSEGGGVGGGGEGVGGAFSALRGLFGSRIGGGDGDDVGGARIGVADSSEVGVFRVRGSGGVKVECVVQWDGRVVVRSWPQGRPVQVLSSPPQVLQRHTWHWLCVSFEPRFLLGDITTVWVDGKPLFTESLPYPRSDRMEECFFGGYRGLLGPTALFQRAIPTSRMKRLFAAAPTPAHQLRLAPTITPRVFPRRDIYPAPPTTATQSSPRSPPSPETETSRIFPSSNDVMETGGEGKVGVEVWRHEGSRVGDATSDGNLSAAEFADALALWDPRRVTLRSPSTLPRSFPPSTPLPPPPTPDASMVVLVAMGIAKAPRSAVLLGSERWDSQPFPSASSLIDTADVLRRIPLDESFAPFGGPLSLLPFLHNPSASHSTSSFFSKPHHPPSTPSSLTISTITIEDQHPHLLPSPQPPTTTLKHSDGESDGVGDGEKKGEDGESDDSEEDEDEEEEEEEEEEDDGIESWAGQLCKLRGCVSMLEVEDVVGILKLIASLLQSSVSLAAAFLRAGGLPSLGTLVRRLPARLRSSPEVWYGVAKVSVVLAGGIGVKDGVSVALVPPETIAPPLGWGVAHAAWSRLAFDVETWVVAALHGDTSPASACGALDGMLTLAAANPRSVAIAVPIAALTTLLRSYLPTHPTNTSTTPSKQLHLILRLRCRIWALIRLLITASSAHLAPGAAWAAAAAGLRGDAVMIPPVPLPASTAALIVGCGSLRNLLFASPVAVSGIHLPHPNTPTLPPSSTVRLETVSPPYTCPPFIVGHSVYRMTEVEASTGTIVTAMTQPTSSPPSPLPPSAKMHLIMPAPPQVSNSATPDAILRCTPIIGPLLAALAAAEHPCDGLEPAALLLSLLPLPEPVARRTCAFFGLADAEVPLPSSAIPPGAEAWRVPGIGGAAVTAALFSSTLDRGSGGDDGEGIEKTRKDWWDTVSQAAASYAAAPAPFEADAALVSFLVASGHGAPILALLAKATKQDETNFAVVRIALALLGRLVALPPPNATSSEHHSGALPLDPGACAILERLLRQVNLTAPLWRGVLAMGLGFDAQVAMDVAEPRELNASDSSSLPWLPEALYSPAPFRNAHLIPILLRLVRRMRGAARILALLDLSMLFAGGSTSRPFEEPSRGAAAENRARGLTKVDWVAWLVETALDAQKEEEEGKRKRREKEKQAEEGGEEEGGGEGEGEEEARGRRESVSLAIERCSNGNLGMAERTSWIAALANVRGTRSRKIAVDGLVELVEDPTNPREVVIVAASTVARAFPEAHARMAKSLATLCLSATLWAQADATPLEDDTTRPGIPRSTGLAMVRAWADLLAPPRAPRDVAVGTLVHKRARTVSLGPSARRRRSGKWSCTDMLEPASRTDGLHLSPSAVTLYASILIRRLRTLAKQLTGKDGVPDLPQLWQDISGAVEASAALVLGIESQAQSASIQQLSEHTTDPQEADARQQLLALLIDIVPSLGICLLGRGARGLTKEWERAEEGAGKTALHDIWGAAGSLAVRATSKPFNLRTDHVPSLEALWTAAAFGWHLRGGNRGGKRRDRKSSSGGDLASLSPLPTVPITPRHSSPTPPSPQTPSPPHSPTPDSTDSPSPFLPPPSDGRGHGTLVESGSESDDDVEILTATAIPKKLEGEDDGEVVEGEGDGDGDGNGVGSGRRRTSSAAPLPRPRKSLVGREERSSSVGDEKELVVSPSPPRDATPPQPLKSSPPRPPISSFSRRFHGTPPRSGKKSKLGRRVIGLSAKMRRRAAHTIAAAATVLPKSLPAGKTGPKRTTRVPQPLPPNPPEWLADGLGVARLVDDWDVIPSGSGLGGGGDAGTRRPGMCVGLLTTCLLVSLRALAESTAALANNEPQPPSSPLARRARPPSSSSPRSSPSPPPPPPPPPSPPLPLASSSLTSSDSTPPSQLPLSLPATMRERVAGIESVVGNLLVLAQVKEGRSSDALELRAAAMAVLRAAASLAQCAETRTGHGEEGDGLLTEAGRLWERGRLIATTVGAGEAVPSWSDLCTRVRDGAEEAGSGEDVSPRTPPRDGEDAFSSRLWKELSALFRHQGMLQPSRAWSHGWKVHAYRLIRHHRAWRDRAAQQVAARAQTEEEAVSSFLEHHSAWALRPSAAESARQDAEAQRIIATRIAASYAVLSRVLAETLALPPWTGWDAKTSTTTLETISQEETGLGPSMLHVPDDGVNDPNTAAWVIAEVGKSEETVAEGGEMGGESGDGEESEEEGGGGEGDDEDEVRSSRTSTSGGVPNHTSSLATLSLSRPSGRVAVPTDSSAAVFATPCWLLMPACVLSGRLELTSSRLLFLPDGFAGADAEDTSLGGESFDPDVVHARAQAELAAAMVQWVPDRDASVCAVCHRALVRGIFSSGRHHCRRCGRVVCGACSTGRRPLPRQNLFEPQRVCDPCLLEADAERTAAGDSLVLKAVGLSPDDTRRRRRQSSKVASSKTPSPMLRRRPPPPKTAMDEAADAILERVRAAKLSLVRPWAWPLHRIAAIYSTRYLLRPVALDIYLHALVPRRAITIAFGSEEQCRLAAGRIVAAIGAPRGPAATLRYAPNSLPGAASTAFPKWNPITLGGGPPRNFLATALFSSAAETMTAEAAAESEQRRIAMKDDVDGGSGGSGGEGERSEREREESEALAISDAPKTPTSSSSTRTTSHPAASPLAVMAQRFAPLEARPPPPPIGPSVRVSAAMLSLALESGREAEVEVEGAGGSGGGGGGDDHEEERVYIAGVPPPSHVVEAVMSWTRAWQMHALSNLDYLMLLNRVAGRSTQDLSRYPVVPWVLKDYVSDSLDLSNPDSYRDLSKPIGALNPTRLATLIERREALAPYDEDTPCFLYGSHYSNIGTVLYFLQRREPYSTQALALQGGRFDHADRLFHSIQEAWENVLSNPSDVKELVPELFLDASVLRCPPHLHLGTRQDGEVLGDVQLPPWAKGSADRFVRLHREALESDIVSAQLHRWIDLIFGFAQRGPAAEAHHNVFHPYTYQGGVDASALADPVQRRSAEAQVSTFGQTPTQLFFRPHPRRLRLHEALAIEWGAARASALLGGRGASVIIQQPRTERPRPLLSILQSWGSTEVHSLERNSIASHRFHLDRVSVSQPIPCTCGSRFPSPWPAIHTPYPSSNSQHHPLPFAALLLPNDDAVLVSGEAGRGAEIWSLGAGSLIGRLPGARMTAADASEDGAMVAIGGADGSVGIWLGSTSAGGRSGGGQRILRPGFGFSAGLSGKPELAATPTPRPAQGLHTMALHKDLLDAPDLVATDASEALASGLAHGILPPVGAPPTAWTQPRKAGILDPGITTTRGLLATGVAASAILGASSPPPRNAVAISGDKSIGRKGKRESASSTSSLKSSSTSTTPLSSSLWVLHTYRLAAAEAAVGSGGVPAGLLLAGVRGRLGLGVGVRDACRVHKEVVHGLEVGLPGRSGTPATPAARLLSALASETLERRGSSGADPAGVTRPLRQVLAGGGRRLGTGDGDGDGRKFVRAVGAAAAAAAAEARAIGHGSVSVATEAQLRRLAHSQLALAAAVGSLGDTWAAEGGNELVVSLEHSAGAWAQAVAESSHWSAEAVPLPLRPPSRVAAAIHSGDSMEVGSFAESLLGSDPDFFRRLTEIEPEGRLREVSSGAPQTGLWAAILCARRARAVVGTPLVHACGPVLAPRHAAHVARTQVCGVRPAKGTLHDAVFAPEGLAAAIMARVHSDMTAITHVTHSTGHRVITAPDSTSCTSFISAALAMSNRNATVRIGLCGPSRSLSRSVRPPRGIVSHALAIGLGVDGASILDAHAGASLAFDRSFAAHGAGVLGYVGAAIASAATASSTAPVAAAKSVRDVLERIYTVEQHGASSASDLEPAMTVACLLGTRFVPHLSRDEGAPERSVIAPTPRTPQEGQGAALSGPWSHIPLASASTANPSLQQACGTDISADGDVSAGTSRDIPSGVDKKVLPPLLGATTLAKHLSASWISTQTHTVDIHKSSSSILRQGRFKTLLEHSKETEGDVDGGGEGGASSPSRTPRVSSSMHHPPLPSHAISQPADEYGPQTPVLSLRGHCAPITAVRVSVALGCVVSGDSEGVVLIHSLHTGSLLHSINVPSSTSSTPSSSTPPTSRPSSTFTSPSASTASFFSGGPGVSALGLGRSGDVFVGYGSSLVAADVSGNVRMVVELGSQVVSLQVSRNARFLLAATQRVVDIRWTADLAPRTVLIADPHVPVTTAAIAKDQRIVLVGFQDGTLQAFRTDLSWAASSSKAIAAE